MVCKHCKKDLLLQYRVFNPNGLYVAADQYFNSLEEAEEYYDKAIKIYPVMTWRLYQYFICNDCDFLEKKCLKNQEIIKKN